MCPDCRFVFRVASDHDGLGVVCPSCERMLRLPTPTDPVPELVRKKSAEELAAEKSEPAEEPEAAGKGKRRRKKRAEDEEDFRPQGQNPVVMIGVVASLGLLAVALAVVVLWPKGEVAPRARNEGPTEVFPVAAASEKVASEDEVMTPEEAAAVVSLDVLRDEIEPVILGFLESTDVVGQSRWVRHAARTRPRMEAWPRLDAPGFRTILWGAGQTRVGKAVLLMVETDDFRQRPIGLVEEDDGWKVDWEAWVGWSEMSWREMIEKRPTEPVLCRVQVTATDYFNYRFSDETAWESYWLESPDAEASLYGYVPKGGVMDHLLKPADNERRVPFLVKLAFPEGETRGNQVEIVEVVGRSWVNPEEEP